MTVILCEKKSVAEHLAKFLNVSGKDKFYFFNDEYYLTWSNGHMFQLSNAKSYSENPWDLNNIPIFPSEFSYTLNQSKKELFTVIKKLFNKADKIINAGDSAREGELIFRYIYNHCPDATNNVFRLWFNGMTDKDFSDAFNSMKSSDYYDSLYYSGLARNHSDWLIGINSTVALTKLMKNFTALPLGRVQTPVFNAVCKRYFDNKNFKSSLSYLPNITISAGSYSYIVNYEKKLENKEDAEKLLSIADDNLICTDYISKEFTEKQPLLFNLTALQATADKLYHFSASKTLKIAQSLYDTHKVLSYPRTDSTYINSNVFSGINKIFDSLKKLPDFKTLSKFVFFDTLPKNCVNDKKINDHYALIPTGEISDNLTDDEKLIFNLVIRQFFAAFSNPCTKMKHNAEFKDNSNNLYTFNSVSVSSLGWRFLIPDNKIKPKPFEFVPGNSYKIIDTDINSVKTKPPSLFSEGSLLIFMESAGKNFDSDIIPDSIKKNGLGMPSTRNGIIDKLLNTYIKKEKNKLIPNDLGFKIYPLIKELKISSVELTSEFEEKLFLISEGKYSYNSFIDDIKKFFNADIFPALKKLDASLINDFSFCPKCHKKTVYDKGKLLECSDSNCDFVLWKSVFDIPLKKQQISDLLNLKEVKLSNIKSKKYQNSFFDVLIKINPDDDFKLIYNYPKKNKIVTDFICPSCGKKIIEYKDYFACENYKNPCQFSISKLFFNYTIDNKNLPFLLSGDKLKGHFMNNKNKKFDASIFLNDKFKIEFDFNNK